MIFSAGHIVNEEVACAVMSQHVAQECSFTSFAWQSVSALAALCAALTSAALADDFLSSSSQSYYYRYL